MDGRASIEIENPESAEVPLIPRDKIHKTDRSLGSGTSGTATVVHIDGLEQNGKPKDVVLKEPHLSLDSRYEVVREAKVISHLLKKGFSNMVMPVGFSPDMQRDPYILKEFVIGMGRNFRHPDDKVFFQSLEGLIPVDGKTLKKGTPEYYLQEKRAKWAWGIINDVLPGVHSAGVVLGDFKPDDFRLIAVGKNWKVKALDFGNSMIIGDSFTAQGLANQETDCLLVFQNIMQYGFGLLGPKDAQYNQGTAAQQMDTWISYLRQKGAHPAILRTAESYANYFKGDRRGKMPFQNGGELRDSLKPVFDSLGVTDQIPQPTPDIKTTNKPEKPISPNEMLAYFREKLAVLQHFKNNGSYPLEDTRWGTLVKSELNKARGAGQSIDELMKQTAHGLQYWYSHSTKK